MHSFKDDGAEEAGEVVVGASGEEESVFGAVNAEAIAEINSPKLINDDGMAQGVFDGADEVSGDGVEGVDGAAVSVIGDKQRVAERTEIAGGSSETPGLVQGSGIRGNSADHQNFADVIAGEKELDGSEVAEKVFDVPIVEDALEAESAAQRSMNGAAGPTAHFALHDNGRHLQHIGADDVIAVAGSVRAGVAGVKKSEQHAAGFQDRPQTSDDGFDEAFVEIVGKVPTKHRIEMGGGVGQVFFQEFLAIEDGVALVIFGEQGGIGGSDEDVLAVDFVSALGEIADIGGGSGPEIENTECLLQAEDAGEFSETAGAAGKASGPGGWRGLAGG